MPSRDMERVNLFLQDFVSRLKAIFPHIKYSILLGGSAARGDFQSGRSDLDLIIYVHDDRDIQPMKDAAFPLFFELDKKHGLLIKKAMGKRRPGHDVHGAGPGGRPAGACALPQPFLVVGPSSPPMGSGGDLFSRLDFIHGFSRALGNSGRMSMKLLYGEWPSPSPLKPGERPSTDRWDPGILSYDFLASLAAAPLSFVMPDRAYARSMRAVFFAFESDIIRYRAGSARLPLFVLQTIYVREHVADAFPSISYPEKVAYCAAAPLRILLRGMRGKGTGKC